MAGTQKLTFVENGGTGASPDLFWQGGKLQLFCEATFGGGSVKLQTLSPKGVTWLDVPNGSFSAAGVLAPLDLAPGRYRSFATTATVVYFYGVSVPTIVTK